MPRTRPLVPISLVSVVFVVLFLGVPVAGQKPPKPTLHPTVAQFADSCGGTACGIRSDGGPYYDGVDGVSSYRVAGLGTTNGWTWDLKAGRTSEPRMLTYDLGNPIGGAAPYFITANDTHGQVYDLSDMLPEQERLVRASFHLIIDRVEYVLRFGQTPNDGSSPLKVTRLSATEFHVRTDGTNDFARFLRGNGPGAVELGIYHVPVDLMLTNQ